MQVLLPSSLKFFGQLGTNVASRFCMQCRCESCNFDIEYLTGALAGIGDPLVV